MTGVEGTNTRAYDNVDDVRKRLVDRAADEKDAAIKASETAQGSMRNLVIEPDDFGSMHKMVADEAKGEFLDPHSKTKAALKSFEALTDGGVNDAGEKMLLAPNFAEIDKVRSRVLREARETGDMDARRELNQLVGMYDKRLDQALENKLFSGGMDDISATKDARAMWKSYYNRYGARPNTAAGTQDVAGRFIKKMVAGEKDTSDFVQALFGSARTGQGAMSKQMVNRAKEILPPEDFEVLRRSAWDHVTQGGLKRTRGETLDDEMLPTKIAERIINFAKRGEGGTEFSQAMFTDAERKNMLRFANVIKRIPPPKAGNPSGSAHEWGRLMRDYMASGLGATVGSSVGSVAGAGGALVGAAVGRQAGKQAVDATTDQAALNALRKEFGIKPGASQDPSYAIRENLRWAGRIAGKSVGASLPKQFEDEQQ
jgi:hypothetical protein